MILKHVHVHACCVSGKFGCLVAHAGVVTGFQAQEPECGIAVDE